MKGESLDLRPEVQSSGSLLISCVTFLVTSFNLSFITCKIHIFGEVIKVGDTVCKALTTWLVLNKRQPVITCYPLPVRGVGSYFGTHQKIRQVMVPGQTVMR